MEKSPGASRYLEATLSKNVKVTGTEGHSSTRHRYFPIAAGRNLAHTCGEIKSKGLHDTWHPGPYANPVSASHPPATKVN